jgi:hypothetical protein
MSSIPEVGDEVGREPVGSSSTKVSLVAAASKNPHHEANLARELENFDASHA